jgi:hypothetical protein
MKPIGHLNRKILNHYVNKMKLIKVKVDKEYDWSKGGILL